jgi:hypothetical protein
LLPLLVVAFFCGGVAKKKKKTMIAFVTFCDGFAAKKSDGFVVKKVTTTMSVPSSMVVVL